MSSKNFFKRFYERQYINMYIIRNNVRFSLDFLNRVQGQNGEKKSIVQNFCTPEASKKWLDCKKDPDKVLLSKKLHFRVVSFLNFLGSRLNTWCEFKYQRTSLVLFYVKQSLGKVILCCFFVWLACFLRFFIGII